MFAYVLPRLEAKFPAVELGNVASNAGHGGGEDESCVGPVLSCRLLHDAIVEDLCNTRVAVSISHSHPY